MKKILLLALVLNLCSCAYMENRRKDLTDIANVNATAISAGLAVNVGPLSLGYFGNSGLLGGSGGRAKIGLGGLVVEEERGAYWGVIYPFEFLEGETRSDNYYNKNLPAFGSVGIDLGFVLGIGVEVDVVQAVDFLLGIFTIDILGDDIEGKEEDVEEVPAEEAPAE